jgi:hypothetical protein
MNDFEYKKTEAIAAVSEARGAIAMMVVGNNLGTRLDAARMFIAEQANATTARASSLNLLFDALVEYEANQFDLDEDKTSELLELFVRAAKAVLGKPQAKAEAAD